MNSDPRSVARAAIYLRERRVGTIARERDRLKLTPDVDADARIGFHLDLRAPVEAVGLVRLAPSYDLLSTLPYGDATTALKLGGEDANWKRRDLLALGSGSG